MKMKSVREMAEEAGFTGWVITARDDYSDPEFLDYYAEQLERFAALVRAQALEEATKAADDQWVKNPNISGGDAIRALVKEK